MPDELHHDKIDDKNTSLREREREKTKLEISPPTGKTAK